MRDKPYILALVAALTIGIATVVAATMWLKKFEASKITKIVVASQDIAAGESLTHDNLKFSEWTGTNIPSGAMLEIGPLFSRSAKSNITNGDVIRESDLVQIISDKSLAASIAPGMRAFSIRVNEEAGVAVFALPGNYVDILLNTKNDSGKPISRIVLERILVLAIAQERISPNKSDPKVVNVITLELSPQQVEQVDLARSMGTVSLVLRNQNDKKLLEAQQQKNDSSVAGKPIISSNTQTRSRLAIEVIRGVSKQTE